MVKKKSSNGSKYQTEYGKALSQLMIKEKKSQAQEKLEAKGITVGKGYSPEKLKKAYKEEKAKEQAKKIGAKVEKALRKKVTVRKVLKGKKMVVRIPEHEPAPYINRYFKNEMEDAKGMFFS